MAARLKIIVLEKLYNDTQSFRVAFWLDVPTTRWPFFADPARVSVWKNATVEDIDRIKNGEVVEDVEPFQAEAGESLPSVQARLAALHAAKQDILNARNPWVRYGTTWDGTTWVVGGVS
jgi:hypothetical protein